MLLTECGVTPLKNLCYCVVGIFSVVANVLATYCDFPGDVNIPTDDRSTGAAASIPSKSPVSIMVTKHTHPAPSMAERP